MNPIRFATPLVEGIIEKRKSQFTMTVNYEGQSVACHAIPAPDLGRGDIFLFFATGFGIFRLYPRI